MHQFVYCVSLPASQLVSFVNNITERQKGVTCATELMSWAHVSVSHRTVSARFLTKKRVGILLPWMRHVSIAFILRKSVLSDFQVCLLP